MPLAPEVAGNLGVFADVAIYQSLMLRDLLVTRVFTFDLLSIVRPFEG